MWKEDEHPRAEDGKFTNGNGEYRQNTDYGEILKGGSSNGGEDKKMTPAEKIASVHIDFDRDNILPELNVDSLKEMGLTQNKKVLLKKSIIDRNAREHSEITQETFQKILAETLYSQKTEIFPANKTKPNYFHFSRVIREGEKFTLVLLDVDEKKENFEIVHAHFVYLDAFERAKNKAKK